MCWTELQRHPLRVSGKNVLPGKVIGMLRIKALSVAILGGLAGAVLPAVGAPAADTGDPDVFRFHAGDDRAAAMTIDAAGNIYIGGSIDTGAEISFAVTKLSPTGTVSWTAFYNGSLSGVDGSALAVAVDATGNVYAAGSINDTDFYPNVDYLVVAFDSSGNQRWAQRFNGPGDGFDRATEIAVDGSGAVYVSGSSYTPSPSFTFDWSTHKYSPAGDLLWERRHLGNDTFADRVADLVVAPDGNVVVTGITRNAENEWAEDVATVKYDPNGNVVWQRQWNDTPPGSNSPRDMEIDSAGRITITGTIGLFPPSPVTLRYDSSGTLLQTVREVGGSSVHVTESDEFYLAGFPAQPDDPFLALYNASGSRIWASPITVGDDETYFSTIVRADSAGAITTAGTIRNVLTHNDDYLVIRFDPDGRELWRYRFNGSFDRDDRVAALAIDSGDNAVVTGTSWNGYQSEGGTSNDIVTLRFTAGTVPPLLAPSELSATGTSSSQIRLSWTDNAGTEDGFRIERCRDISCSDFALIATVGHDVTTFTDGGLSRNTKYSYRVQAFNSGAVSDYSNVATGKTRQR